MCCSGKQERYGGERKGSRFLLFACKLRARRKTLGLGAASCFCNTIPNRNNSQNPLRESLSLWAQQQRSSRTNVTADAQFTWKPQIGAPTLIRCSEMSDCPSLPVLWGNCSVPGATRADAELLVRPSCVTAAQEEAEGQPQQSLTLSGQPKLHLSTAGLILGFSSVFQVLILYRGKA